MTGQTEKLRETSLRVAGEKLVGVVWVENLGDLLINGLTKLLVAFVGKVQVVAHIVVADGAILRVDKVVAIRAAHKSEEGRGLLVVHLFHARLHQMVHQLDLLAQSIGFTATRRNAEHHDIGLGQLASHALDEGQDAVGHLFGCVIVVIGT